MSKGTVNWKGEIQTVAEMRQAGKTWKYIGEFYGVNQRTVERHYAKLTRFPVDKPRSYRSKTLPPPPYPVYRPSFPDVSWPEEVNWRELLQTWEDVNAQHERMDPYQERFTVDLQKISEPIAIASASDLHMGGGFTNHRAIRETIELIIKTPGMYVGITGDSIEGFIPGIKPAESVEQQAGSVKAQLHALKSLVYELTSEGKLLWMSWGDHDAKWFEQLIGLNVPKQMVHDRVPYFTGRGLIKLQLGQEEYYILANHAERGTSRWDETMPSRQAYERSFPADVVITGHFHKPAFKCFTHYEELRAAGVNLGGTSWLVVNGTFKTGPDPYSIRGWSRGVLGVPTLVFLPDAHEVDCFRSPEKAMRYMKGLRDGRAA